MRYSKIISIFALLFMLSLTVFAFGNKSSNSDNGKGAAAKSNSVQQTGSGTRSGTSDVGWRPDGSTYRMSLEELDNWDFTGYTGDELAEKIQEYGEHYYVTCSEEAIYAVPHGYAASQCPTKSYRGKSVIYQDASTYPTLDFVLNDITAGGTINDAYILTAADGHRYINPDPNIVSSLISELGSLGPHNAALAQKYLESQANPTAATHPVVIVIEAVGWYVGDGTGGASASDMCYRIGGEVPYRMLLQADMKSTADALAISQASNTVKQNAVETTIAELVGFDKYTTSGWPAKWIRRFYNYKRTGSTVESSSYGSTWAWDAWQTASNRYTGINGCTMIQLGLTIPPTDLSDYPDGKYTWHIDAEGATLTSSGHKEDQVVQLGGSTSGAISKINIVGALSINQDNAYEWENWLTAKRANIV